MIASCSVCLAPKPVVFGNINIHYADTTSGPLLCPGNGEPPVIAADLRPGDVLDTQDTLWLSKVEGLVAFDGGDGQYVCFEYDGRTRTVPADLPVVVVSRAPLKVA